MSEFLTIFGVGAGVSGLVLLLVVWTIFWKGWALWIAARKGEIWWFLAMLIINTAGILEIIYIFIIKKMNFNFKTKKFEEGNRGPVYKEGTPSPNDTTTDKDKDN